MRAGSGAEAEATADVGRGLDRCVLDGGAATLCIVGGIYTVHKQWRSQDFPQCSGGGRGKDLSNTKNLSWSMAKETVQ